MFTVEQIRAAHDKVKSGADFPAFIRDIWTLGVTYYETFVADGHTDYNGANDYKTSSTGRYDALTIDVPVNAEQFKCDLKEHQQGKTFHENYKTQACAIHCLRMKMPAH